MNIRLAAASLALLACSCASQPRAAYQLHCPIVEARGPYSVFHMRDSKAGIYFSDRWRCAGPMTEEMVLNALR